MFTLFEEEDAIAINLICARQIGGVLSRDLLALNLCCSSVAREPRGTLRNAAIGK